MDVIALESDIINRFNTFFGLEISPSDTLIELFENLTDRQVEDAFDFLLSLERTYAGKFPSDLRALRTVGDVITACIEGQLLYDELAEMPDYQI